MAPTAARQKTGSRTSSTKKTPPARKATKPASRAAKASPKRAARPAKATKRRTATKKTTKPSRKGPARARPQGPTARRTAGRPAPATRNAAPKRPGAPKRKTSKGPGRSRRAAAGPAPPPAGTIQPMLAVPDMEEAISFLENVGFKTMMKMPGPGGVPVHAVLASGNGMIHIDPVEAPGVAMSTPRMEAVKRGPRGLGMSLYLMVDDVDKVHETLKGLGAKVDEAPTDKFWGDRTMSAYDPAGYLWHFAQNVKQVSEAEMQRALEQMAPM